MKTPENELEPQALSAVLRRLSHDLRTPLSTLSMGLDLLPSLRDDPAEFEEVCQMMRRCGTEEMSNLIDRYLADPTLALRQGRSHPASDDASG